MLQEGARKLLQAAIESEVIDYIQYHKDRRDENGQRLVVRNGHLPEREVVSGVGPIRVRQPRVRHRDKGRFWVKEQVGSSATNIVRLKPDGKPTTRHEASGTWAKSATFTGGPTASTSMSGSMRNEPACWS